MTAVTASRQNKKGVAEFLTYIGKSAESFYIGTIVTIVAFRYLCLDFEASWAMGVVFFIVNMISWTLLISEAYFLITYDFCAILWILHILFIVTLVIVAFNHQGEATFKRFGAPREKRETMPTPGEIAAYQIRAPPTEHRDRMKSLVVEAWIVAIGCFLIMFFSFFIYV